MFLNSGGNDNEQFFFSKKFLEGGKMTKVESYKGGKWQRVLLYFYSEILWA